MVDEMKKFKQVSSILLALGVVCSLMAPASAASSPMARLSDHAGTERTVVVMVDDGETVQEHTLSVAIPSDATKGEELDLFHTAAKQAAGVPATRGTPTLRDTISVMDRITVAASPAMVVGEGELEDNYDALAVTFDEVSVYNNATKLNVRIDNNHHGSDSYASSTIRTGTYTLVILQTNGGGTSQGGDDLVLEEGDYITAWANTNRGGASVGTVYISAE